MSELNEPILPDDYPVYPGYFYVADGRVVQSEQLGTVAHLKKVKKAAEVRRCDIVGRQAAARKAR